MSAVWLIWWASSTSALRRDLGIVAPAGRAQDRQAVQDHRQAALVVGDAGAVEALALLLDRLGGQDAGPVHSVLGGHQHQLALAAALQPARSVCAGAQPGARQHAGQAHAVPQRQRLAQHTSPTEASRKFTTAKIAKLLQYLTF